jgi:hypothetical protein
VASETEMGKKQRLLDTLKLLAETQRVMVEDLVGGL